jgi:hypothetical protein
MANSRYVNILGPSSSFGSPRQKTWLILFLGEDGWVINDTAHSLPEAQKKVKSLINRGGEFMSKDRVMIAEVVPTDIFISPNV